MLHCTRVQDWWGEGDKIRTDAVASSFSPTLVQLGSATTLTAWIHAESSQHPPMGSALLTITWDRSLAWILNKIGSLQWPGGTPLRLPLLPHMLASALVFVYGLQTSLWPCDYVYTGANLVRFCKDSFFRLL